MNKVVIIIITITITILTIIIIILGVIQGLNTELYTDIEEQSDIHTENIPEMDQSIQNEASTSNNQNIPDLNKGIKLPKSTLQWSTAYDYFKFALHSNQPITSQDLDSNIKLLNNIVYEYFFPKTLVILIQRPTIIW